MGRSQTNEFDEVTAGIVVQERSGQHRFYASHALFRPLDRRLFPSIKRAVWAARERLERQPKRASGVEPATQIAGSFL